MNTPVAPARHLLRAKDLADSRKIACEDLATKIARRAGSTPGFGGGVIGALLGVEASGELPDEGYDGLPDRRTESL
jgi:hypothetical protein